MEKINLDFMKKAISLAREAEKIGEVPVGAVIVKDGRIIASAYNLRENGGGATAHAELLAIEKACEMLGSWRLSGCELYVTLEPCPMCAGAIVNARIDRVIYGVKDYNGGAFGSVIDLNSYPLGHKPEIIDWVCQQECLMLLQSFFARKRMKNKN
jgi:tRNA(adenine34) deaminase